MEEPAFVLEAIDLCELTRRETESKAAERAEAEQAKQIRDLRKQTKR